MAEAFLHFGGGGSSESLNFTVIGGTSQPATASENTIWVNTDATITGYTISATAPEEPTDGMVWITPGASGEAVVTVTKKNPIKVYPISAKQYVSGAWVDVTAKSYQNGEWVDWWDGELFKDGNEYGFITGGWTSAGKGLTSSNSAVGTPSLINDGTTLTMEITSNTGGAIFYTAKKIDLRGYTQVEFDGEISGVAGYDTLCNLRAWSDIGEYSTTNAVASKFIKQSTTFDGTFSLDISGCNDESGYYVGFGLWTTSPKVVMRSLILK